MHTAQHWNNIHSIIMYVYQRRTCLKRIKLFQMVTIKNMYKICPHYSDAHTLVYYEI